MAKVIAFVQDFGNLEAVTDLMHVAVNAWDAQNNAALENVTLTWGSSATQMNNDIKDYLIQAFQTKFGVITTRAEIQLFGGPS